MIATLRQRNFALMWLAGLISLAGDWALSVGLPIYVYTLTHSVLATAIMLMCAVTPGVLVGSAAGVFVDRWDHKRTMVAINATSPPLTPYAWRARRRHHRRQRPPQLHRHPHATTHPTCASPNAPPTRWCSPPAPITDHPLASRHQIPLTQRRAEWMVAPVGSVGAAPAHGHANTAADKNGPRVIAAQKRRLRLRWGLAQPDFRVHTRLSVSRSDWTEH
jgi:Transmembrane secretion effector